MAYVPKSQRRKCAQCGKPNAITPNRLCATCKRANKRASSAKSHDLRVQKTYGLGPGDYQRLYEASGGRCYICKRYGTKRLAVDHDHQTGEVRGLLCTSCNHYLLGKVAHDDADLLREILESAVMYLTYPPARTVLEGDHTEDGQAEA